MGFRTKAYKRKYSAHRNSFCDVMTKEDFLKAKEALEKAHIPEPYKILASNS